MNYFDSVLFVVQDETSNPRPVKTANKFKRRKDFWQDPSNFKGDSHFKLFNYGVCRGNLDEEHKRFYGTVMVEFLFNGDSDSFKENVGILKEKLEEFVTVTQVNFCMRKELYPD